MDISSSPSPANTVCSYTPGPEFQHSIAEAWTRSAMVVCRGMFDARRVARLVDEFQSEVLTASTALPRHPNFRAERGPSRHPHAFLATHQVNEHGLMIEAIKDPHNLEAHPGLAGLTLGLLCSREIQQALHGLSGDADGFTLQQSMLFDLNPATEPHQDAYYIDSDPRGHVVGVWIALEDIHEDAGRFYLLPQSQIDGPGADAFELDNSAYLDLLDTYVQGANTRPWAPELRAGDVVFWSGRIVHGALPCRDPARSRKSITAHYCPRRWVAGSRFRRFVGSIERVASGMRYVTTNRPDADGRRIVQTNRRVADVNGHPVAFLAVRTADGEQTTFAGLEAIDPILDR